MKNKDKKSINLDALKLKLQVIKSKPDSRLRFELIHMLFIIVNLVNVNVALYSTSYFNYNFSLLIFNTLFLSRRLFQVLYSYNLLRCTNAFTLPTLSLYILFGIYSVLVLHSLASLFFQQSFNIILNMVCPFTAYQFLAYNAMASRYSDGSLDCFYNIQQISLSSLEIFYCVGYLPYKFFPTSGFYFNLPAFFNTLAVLFLCDNALHFGEFINKRSAELIFFAHSQGEWQKTGEIATEEWQNDKAYNKNDLVRYKNECWKGVGKVNLCEPGKFENFVLNFLFKDPVRSLKGVNFTTAIGAGIHNIYMIYQPFHYSQAISVLIFSYVLTRNIGICKRLKLPNV